MKEHFSLKLVLILFLITAVFMGTFAGIRQLNNNQQFEREVVDNAKIISERIASHVTPSIWDIYLSSENRRFSEEVASAVLNSEMKSRYIDAIIVYGRFGHVYMGRVVNEQQKVVAYSDSQHMAKLLNHPNQVDHPIRNGSMTIGKVTVYYNDQPLREEQLQTLKIDLLQTAIFSVFIVLVLFFTIKKVLIKPLTSLQIAKNTFDSLDEGILHVDNDYRVFTVNPAFTQMTGYSEQQMLHHRCDIFRFTAPGNGQQQTIDEVIKDGNSWAGEACCVRQDGSSFPVYLSASHVVDERSNNLCRVLVFQDISRQKQDEQKLKDFAFLDPLTGLANRRRFEDLMHLEIESCKRSGEKLGLLFIDLDDFKFINDTLGHAEGDAMLIEMANRFNRRIRESDHIARLGGDEFTVIISHVHSEEDLAEVAQELIDLAKQPVLLQGQQYKVGATVGISVYPKDGDELGELMKYADSAMYQAKGAGKGQYAFFSSDLDHRIQHRQRIKTLLRNCIENNELYLNYQPKTALDSAAFYMAGAEALLRWNSPEYGLIPPDEFIPLAEETSVILEIGEWVIQQVFVEVARWNKAANGAPVKISINLSPHQLHDENLLPFIRSEMNKSGIQPAWIEFEITETAVIKSFETSVIALEKLKGMGFSLALDDFGTGYSSLNYLTKLPIDTLKIDKSFVFDVGQSASAESVVEAIVTLAKSLDLATVAEGIESKGQLTFLRQLGCEFAQGYYFSRPLSLSDFEGYLADAHNLTLLMHSDNTSKTLQ